MAIRILTVDDHVVVLRGLAAIIHGEPDMQVVASAATGEEAVEQYAEHRPDVVLMDLQMRGMSGFDAIRAIRAQDAGARIIVLTMHHGDEDVYRAFESGAAAYLLKETVADSLVHVIREVHAGKMALTGDTAAQLARRVNERALTPREEQVMQFVAKGLRNRDIGAALGISEETVQAHVRNIFSKLDVHDRTAALAAALRRGIVHMD